jgi:transcriptional repressor NrdR
MKCPFCNNMDTRVLDTRLQKEGNVTRRRRECSQCKGRFTTQEIHMQCSPFVIKKDGRREPFSRQKVLRGIQAACQKRPISLAQMENVVDRINHWVLSRNESEVSAESIGHKVMFELRLLDDVAYVRFASVYRTFQDIDEFLKTLEGEKAVDGADSFSLSPS